MGKGRVEEVQSLCSAHIEALGLGYGMLRSPGERDEDTM